MFCKIKFKTRGTPIGSHSTNVPVHASFVLPLKGGREVLQKIYYSDQQPYAAVQESILHILNTFYIKLYIIYINVYLTLALKFKLKPVIGWRYC